VQAENTRHKNSSHARDALLANIGYISLAAVAGAVLAQAQVRRQFGARISAFLAPRARVPMLLVIVDQLGAVAHQDPTQLVQPFRHDGALRIRAARPAYFHPSAPATTWGLGQSQPFCIGGAAISA